MEPRIGQRDQPGDATKTAEHPRRVILRIPGSRDALAIGAREPMRLVAPFGYSSPADLGIDLERHVTTLAEAGADAVQELSTTGPYREVRSRICVNIGIPYGTVLTYEFVDRLRRLSRVTESAATRLAAEILEEQCTLGISYSTIHASLSRSLLASTEKSRRHRAIAVPSRSAAMLLTVMRRHRIDNPLFLAWSELVAILRKHKVAASMGASLRPAAISDALDHAHRAEIAAQGVLVSYAHRENVHVLVEGLSHALPDDIAEYVALVNENCEGAPATALGPLPIDVAAGRDHIAAVPGIVLVPYELSVCNL
jgi:phosphomethylpyrimidine synthase